ncbi:5'-AMP-activated protein kinase subunit gamma-1 [Salpingoeca rosetta]|uniref:5'-AMP-activated protein kinase subunit gamma-1 n=1 Tax=Salpingoeca rosetta (strain ATCC 50818 / BSB-021) TaxID=946362 RepID=F2UH97_SALR5|nr:5'-AMP-activated protein kinase subunit gamma-1 [Salpingoeca rosetta]EGD76496.1 5'-AMP-activated protein kinase subunit gamma-1 [Salpingoeca rosetta]|eukprot:XP_004991410.1 5'-AMP-activated protein kinase subunit gamma-1 [Salpingoeca rosetta]
MSHHQQQQQQQQQQPQQPQPPRQYQVPTTNAVQMLNDGHFLRGSSDADGTPQRSRTDSTSSETRLVDSEPLQDGPLFSGRPRQKEEQLTMTKHSYTPSKSRPQPRDVAATASSSLGAPSATLPANGSDRSSLATSPTPSQTRSQNISSESLSAAGTTVEEEQDAIRRFLSRFTCYDMMPVSVKMVVLDTQLHVKKAFFALVQNQIRSAPLWDSRKQQFVGMLTVTDFINILLKYYVSPDSKMEELEEHRIQTWRDMSSDKRPHTLACMDPSLSVLEALTMLLEYRIHRLPVIDSYTGNAISILTHKRILQFIHLNVSHMPLSV